MITRDKIEGMFLGVAIGDALGAPIETMKAKDIQNRHGRITTMIASSDDHPWFKNEQAGTTTDDWQLTRIVAESLIALGVLSMDDMAERHVKALHETTHGWGKSTKEAIQRIELGVHWRDSGKTTKKNRGAGNGVIMKMAPLIAWLATAPGKESEVIYDPHRNIRNFTCMTHATWVAIVASVVHECVVASLLADNCKGALLCAETSIKNIHRSLPMLEEEYCANNQINDWYDLLRGLAELRVQSENGSISRLTDEAMIEKFSGKKPFAVQNSLLLSYTCFMRNPTSIEALYDVVNAGGDTDTNGSIVGAMLGALHGSKIFPEHLINGLRNKEEVQDVARRFSAII